MKNGLPYFRYSIYTVRITYSLNIVKIVENQKVVEYICQTSLYELLCDITENIQSNYVTTLARR